MWPKVLWTRCTLILTRLWGYTVGLAQCGRRYCEVGIQWGLAQCGSTMRYGGSTMRCEVGIQWGWHNVAEGTVDALYVNPDEIVGVYSGAMGHAVALQCAMGHAVALQCAMGHAVAHEVGIRCVDALYVNPDEIGGDRPMCQ